MSQNSDLPEAQKENISAPLWKPDDLSASDQYIGFPISLRRLATILICGAAFLNFHYIYMICWGFKHFRSFVRSGTKGNFVKFLCSYFLPLTFFKLMSLYDERAKTRGIDLQMHKVLIPVSYLLLTFFSVAFMSAGEVLQFVYKDSSPLVAALDPISEFMDVLAFVPLFLFQHKVNQLNQKLFPEKVFSPPLTKKQKFLVAFFLIGGLFLQSLHPLSEWMSSQIPDTYQVAK